MKIMVHLNNEHRNPNDSMSALFEGGANERRRRAVQIYNLKYRMQRKLEQSNGMQYMADVSASVDQNLVDTKEQFDSITG